MDSHDLNISNHNTTLNDQSRHLSLTDARAVVNSFSNAYSYNPTVYTSTTIVQRQDGPTQTVPVYITVPQQQAQSPQIASSLRGGSSDSYQSNTPQHLQGALEDHHAHMETNALTDNDQQQPVLPSPKKDSAMSKNKQLLYELVREAKKTSDTASTLAMQLIEESA